MNRIEKINQIQVNTKALETPQKLEIGTKTSANFFRDPKWILFTLSRYKFVSKMLIGRKNVFEVGCGDGFGACIVLQALGSLTCIELDARMIRESKKIHPFKNQIKFIQHDFIKRPIKTIKYDACYCLDVLEHIDINYETQFVYNICKSLHKNGIGIFGMPSLESQVYASQISKEGHVNCKSGDQLKLFMNKFFDTVFIFSMNDEVLHTGFHPMSQYLIALCSHPKK